MSGPNGQWPKTYDSKDGFVSCVLTASGAINSWSNCADWNGSSRPGLLANFSPAFLFALAPISRAGNLLLLFCPSVSYCCLSTEAHCALSPDNLNWRIMFKWRSCQAEKHFLLQAKGRRRQMSSIREQWAREWHRQQKSIRGRWTLALINPLMRHPIWCEEEK